MDKLNKNIFLFYLIFWVCGRIYFLAPTYLEVKIFHSIGLHFDILCLLSYLVYTTDYKNMKRKVFWAYFLLYELLGFIFFIIVQLGGDNNQRALNWAIEKKAGSFYLSTTLPIIEHIFIPVFVVFVTYKIYNRFAYFDIDRCDELNGDSIFLVFRYPKNLIGLCLCVFSPFKASTIALYGCGFIYRFKKSKSKLVCEHITRQNLLSGKYFLIDTKINLSTKRDELKSLVGTPWSLRHNCLTKFQSVIGPLQKYLGGW